MASRRRQFEVGHTRSYGGLRSCQVWIGLLAPLLISTPTLAQEQTVPRPPEVSGSQEPLLERKDWYKVNSLTESILSTTLTREKWGEDYDHFLLSLYLNQYQANWFDFDTRVRLMTDSLARRYRLRDDQLPPIRSLLMRETGVFLVQNGRELMNFAASMQAERTWDRPVTSDTAAQWARLHAPLLEAFERTADRFTTDFSLHLDEAQRALLEQDRGIWKDRMQRWQTLLSQWQAGNWSAAEWGLNSDGTIPLRGEALRHLQRRIDGMKANSAFGGTSASAPGSITDPGEADPWTQLVERYITYYELDSAVAGSARAVGRDITQRYQPRHKQFLSEMSTLKQRLGDTKLSSERRQALEEELGRKTFQMQMFQERLCGELFNRLDRLLSARQAARPPMPGRPAAASQPGR